MAMTVDELIRLISNEEGEIYPFSYAANMMGAHGVDKKMVQYFHDAASEVNRASSDRAKIMADYRNGKPYKQARRESFLRLNPHLATDCAALAEGE